MANRGAVAAILMVCIVTPTATGQDTLTHVLADGWGALQADDLVVARRRFTRAVATNAENARAHEGLARVASAEGDTAEAVSHYETALRHAPNIARLHLAVGRLLSDMREHGRATDHLRSAVDLHGESAETWQAYALALWRVEWYEQAADAYARAIALDDEDPWAYVGLGDTRLREGRLDEAIAAYDMAIDRDAAAYAAHCGKGAALSKQGKFDTARQSLEQSIVLRADYAPAHYELGVALQHERNYEDAISAFAHATQLDRWDASAVMNIARCYGRLGARDLAKKAHNHAVKLQQAQDDLATARAYIAKYPTRPDGYIGIGMTYARMGQQESAITVFKQALERDPNSESAYAELGDLYLAARMISEAIDAHRILARLRPKDIETRVMLGMLLREAGEDGESRAVLREAHDKSRARVSEFGSDGDWNLLAYVLYAKGEFASAEAAMHEAIRLNPREPSYAARLGEIRAATEKPR
ncbi:MAG: tetratricopeptide repeat protein [Candidatus Poribacteria bacterium]|jgi:tetratricopeptide (TPR) repeat protein